MSVEFDDVKFAPKRTVPAVVIENKKYQELLRLARIGAEAEKACRECNKELHVVVSKMEKTTMTAEKAIRLLRPYSHDCRNLFDELEGNTRIEIAALIERLQSCQSCEKQSNQFFSKCENCEVMKE